MHLSGTKTAAAQAEWQSVEPLDPAAWIPVVHLALEGFGGLGGSTLEQRAASLRRELAEEILLDDIGRACVPRGVARVMYEERARWEAGKEEQRLAREAREKEALADSAKKQQTLRNRVRALAERETLGDPLTDMKRADIEQDWERAANTRDEIAAGGLIYHPINEKEKS